MAISVNNIIPDLKNRFANAIGGQDEKAMRQVAREVNDWIGSKDVHFTESDRREFREFLQWMHCRSKASTLPHLPPTGIRNSGVNCWANAMIHMIAGAPAFAKKLFSDDQFESVTRLLEQYFTNRPVDSEQFRHFLRLNGTGQEDPFIGFETLFEKANSRYEMQCTVSEFETTSTTKQPEVMVQLDMNKMRASEFSQLFHDALNHETDRAQHVQMKFERAPEDLFVRANRYGWSGSGYYKINESISHIPQTFSLKSDYVAQRETGEYALTGAIIHLGESFRSGHYIYLGKREGNWYLTNDDSVFIWNDFDWELVEGREIKKTEVPPPIDLLEKGYIFHYAKTGILTSRVEAHFPTLPLQGPLVSLEPSQSDSRCSLVGTLFSVVQGIYTYAYNKIWGSKEVRKID